MKDFEKKSDKMVNFEMRGEKDDGIGAASVTGGGARQYIRERDAFGGCQYAIDIAKLSIIEFGCDTRG